MARASMADVAALNPQQSSLKRAMDLVFAILALIFISPIMLWISVRIAWQKDGPIFFRQQRHGLNGRVFDILKFRSMTHTASQSSDAAQATRDDARVTPFGAFLRRTSLDELPQLFNVLRGEMSMVGPRPHALAHDFYYATLIPEYTQRQRVKPGITGLAQITGWRGETPTLDKMQARVTKDLEYIARWSAWLDVKILIRTALTFLRHPNAY